MSESLEPIEKFLPNPATGELIDLANPVDVARALVEIRELQEKMSVVTRICAGILSEEAKRRGETTMFLPGFRIPVSRSTQITWDLEKLRELKNLGLPVDRWNALVRTTVEEKVSANEAKKIAAANPEYAEVIREARRDFVGEPTIGKVERYINEAPSGS